MGVWLIREMINLFKITNIASKLLANKALSATELEFRVNHKNEIDKEVICQHYGLW